jgi:excisionase family DNA binding protein
MTVDLSRLYTTTTAAAELGVTRDRVSKMIAAGRLKATKVGLAYLITPEQLDAVRIRKSGRPPGIPRNGNGKLTGVKT